MKIAKTHDHIVSELKKAGIDDAESEARIILSVCANLSLTDIHMRPDEEIDPAVSDRIEEIIKKRLMRQPLQYICGRWNFMGLDFYVEPGVLIPRSDTEILVESALESLHDGMKILDLCTGTGCILISLLKYSNDCEGTGVDISDKALSLAQKNAAELLCGAGVEQGENDACSKPPEVTDRRCMFLKGDLYDALNENPDGTDREAQRFDMIVSNPPYIPTAVIETLEPEVKDYEPHLALDGGNDGLDLIHRIIDGAQGHLIPGGEIFIEIGYDQGEAVRKLMEEAGLTQVEVIKDYAGLDRVVHGRRPIL